MTIGRNILISKYAFVKLVSNEEATTYRGFELDGKKMTNKITCLEEIYKELGLHDYLHVANYDGLFELLQPDLWPSLDKMVITIRSSKDFIKLDRSIIQHIFDIFKDVESLWSTYKSPNSFIIVML